MTPELLSEVMAMYATLPSAERIFAIRAVRAILTEPQAWTLSGHLC